MAFTDNCDLFVAVHEDAFNRVIGHVQRQRPSLFNYATKALAARPDLLCRRIEVHPIIGIRGNPLVNIVDPLPIPGTDFGLDFCVQMTSLRIDFHPGNQFALPPELTPLKPESFAMRMSVCVGLACPPDEIVNRLIPPPQTSVRDDRKDDKQDDRQPKPPLRPLPFGKLRCFCLDAFITGGVRIVWYNGKPYLEPTIDGIELVDVRPQGLEDALECYIKLVLKLSVLPGLRVLLEMAPLDIIKDKVRLAISPMPTSAALPVNPAIADDQLKAFVKIEVI